jgi:uncharacterized protein (TIGR02611 family)
VLLKTARKLVIAVFGSTVLLLGLIMLPAPGPGIPIVLAGLAILGLEFVWARRLLRKMKRKASGAMNRVRGGAPDPPKPTGPT